MVRAIAFLAAAALVSAPGATAKAPPSGMDVCGTSSCVHVDWAQSVQFWIGAQPGAARPPGPSSFYVLRWRWQTTGPETISYYIPAAHTVRLSSENGGRPAWASISGAADAVLVGAAASLEPFSVPAPTEVTVGARTARGPETYLRLFKGPGAGFAPVTRWIKVSIRSEPPSPWTDGQVNLQISARGRIVYVDGWVHKISLKLANRARRGLPLR